MKPIDSHAHLLSEAFEADRQALLKTLSGQVQAVIECASAPADFEAVQALTQQYSYIYGAVGVHPESVDAWEANSLATIEHYLQYKKIIAIGEIGLDYYWKPQKAEAQKEVLRAQLRLAIKNDMPVILHNRDATEDFLHILAEHNGVRGVVHCFTEGPEVAEKALAMGLYIGIGGIVTFKNAGKVLEVAKMLPLNKLLIETDSPYLAPVPKRGKRNNPAYVEYVAAFLAEERGLSTKALIEITNENAKTLFHIG